MQLSKMFLINENLNKQDSGHIVFDFSSRNNLLPKTRIRFNLSGLFRQIVSRTGRPVDKNRLNRKPF